MEPEYWKPEIKTGAIVPSWECPKCHHTNTPLAGTVFPIPCFSCSSCGLKGDISYSISLTRLQINGIGVIPPIVNQDKLPICTVLATLNAMGIILRIDYARKGWIVIRTLSWQDLLQKYCRALNCEFNGPTQLDKAWGRVKGMLDVVKDLGVVDELGGIYQIKKWRWFSTIDFEEAVKNLCNGVPLLTVVRYFSHFLTLGENDIYSTKSFAAGEESALHEIVLIGATAKSGHLVFEFVDTHGSHNQVNGIGKVYAEECMGCGIIEWQP